MISTFGIDCVLFWIEDDKKILCQMLGKLYFPDEVDEDKIRTLKLLLNTLQRV
jgi:condensin complex subunit 3